MLVSELETSINCDYKFQGLWLGIICALVVQVVCLLSITLRTDWDREVNAFIIALLREYTCTR